MYSLIYSDKVLKQLRKLDNHIRDRIINTLERCRIRPYPHVVKVVNSPYFRIRVGDYRIIIDINDNELKILVIELGQRDNVYKKI